MEYFSGLLLGLAMILPIGPQNIFVLTQGLTGGYKRGLAAAVTAGFCDTTLILAGAGGLAVVLTGWPWLRTILLVVGSLFLFYLGINYLRDSSTAEMGVTATTAGDLEEEEHWLRSLILYGIGVSWGNPHAILDTVAVLGSAIAAYDPAMRVPFAAGVLSASWFFFFTLVLVGQLLRKRITGQAQIWIKRISGVIMLIFGVVLGLEGILVG